MSRHFGTDGGNPNSDHGNSYRQMRISTRIDFQRLKTTEKAVQFMRLYVEFETPVNILFAVHRNDVKR